MKKTKLKALALSTAMVITMLPLTISAQRSDVFFHNSNENDLYNNRGEIGTSLHLDSGTPNDPTAPIGNGLLIMLGAGTVYTLLKKKED